MPRGRDDYSHTSAVTGSLAAGDECVFMRVAVRWIESLSNTVPTPRMWRYHQWYHYLLIYHSKCLLLSLTGKYSDTYSPSIQFKRVFQRIQKIIEHVPFEAKWGFAFLKKLNQNKSTQRAHTSAKVCMIF